jgi:hypothetical protein
LLLLPFAVYIKTATVAILTKKKLLYFFSVHAITNLSKKIRTFFELIEFTIEKKIFLRYTNGTKRSKKELNRAILS